MSQKKETFILLGALIITGAIIAGGGGWLWNRFNSNGGTTATKIDSPPAANSSQPTLPPPGNPQGADSFPAPKTVPADTTVTIAGSTSMVNINEALKEKFQATFSGTKVISDAKGSDQGIISLLLDKVDLSASSRPLTTKEIDQGLVALPIANDAIAVVVSQDNPFKQGLSLQQIRDIFTGSVTNWSQVGGPSASIQVINRPTESGTRQIFQLQGLQGKDFGEGANFQTMARDATTPILQALGKQGVSYATYVQVENQKTVRVVSIDNTDPSATNYPLRRQLYYVYKQPPTPQVSAFLGFATSPQGQLAIATIE